MAVTSAKSILVEMETLGTEQARKTYQRHGVGDKVFGVSYADLGKFQKKLRSVTRSRSICGPAVFTMPKCWRA